MTNYEIISAEGKDVSILNQTREYIVKNVDANSFVDTGCYFIDSGINTDVQFLNFPFRPNGVLYVRWVNPNSIIQFFIQNGGDAFIRLYWYGGWCSWRLIA